MFFVFFSPVPDLLPTDVGFGIYKSEPNTVPVQTAFVTPELNVNGINTLEMSVDWVVNGQDCGGLCEFFFSYFIFNFEQGALTFLNVILTL